MGARLESTGSVRGAPWRAGTVIGGRYRLVGPLGAGAMGEVWRAEHITLGTPVGVKLVDLAAQQDPREALGRFMQEARAAAGLKSPHVVQILDHGANGEIAYIAMELLEGESLATRLARERRLSPEELLKVVREVAVGIDRAHEQGILHRDLKPANIFFAKVDGREVVKVLDFGIAKVIGAKRRDAIVETQAGLVMGTPAYMSPEQVLGQALDARSDIWQLGVIAFECACGALPFNGAALGELFVRICSGNLPVPSAVAPVPEGFDAWFARAAQRSPDARFATALELASALEPVLAPPPPVAPPAGDPITASGVRRGVTQEELEAAAAEPPPAPPPRRALWMGVAAGAAIVCGAGLAVALLGGSPDADVVEIPLPSAPPAAVVHADPVEAAAPRPAPTAAQGAAAPPPASSTSAAPAATSAAVPPPAATSAAAPPPPAPGPRPRPRTRERQVEEDLAL